MALVKSEMKTLKPGDKAPNFSLKNVDGKTVGREDFKGKPLVVIFMCNHCPYVKAKMDEIGEIFEKYGDKAGIIGINSNDAENYPADSFENMKEVAEEHGYDYYLYDETQEVAKAYGAECTPDPYVFNEDHELVYHGRINDAMQPNDEPTKHDLKEVIDKVLKGEEVKEWFRPSMGCSIKWK